MGATYRAHGAFTFSGLKVRRIIAQGKTFTSPQSGKYAALRLFDLLDLLSYMPSSASLRAPCIHARLRRLAPKYHEISVSVGRNKEILIFLENIFAQNRGWTVSYRENQKQLLRPMWTRRLQ